MSEHLVATCTLFAVAAIAIWTDVRERRIPNWLTVSALVAGLSLRAAGGGSLYSGLAGAGIGLAVALPVFAVGGLGGGDVKLLTGIGALLGLEHIAVALAATALAGGVLAAAALTIRGSWRPVLVNIKKILWKAGLRVVFGPAVGGPSSIVTLNSPSAVRTPYGVAIAVGAIAGWFLRWPT